MNLKSEILLIRMLYC